MKVELFEISNSINVENWEAFSHILPVSLYEVRPNWNYIVATIDNVVVGILGFTYEDEASIHWLYVEPEYRRQKVATRMFEFLEERMTALYALTNISFEFYIDENDFDFDSTHEKTGIELWEFIASLDDYALNITHTIYEILPEIIMDSFENIDLYHHKVSNNALRLSQIPEHALNALLENASKLQVYDVVDLTLWSNNLVDDLCLCQYSNGEIKSAIITARIDDNTFSLDYVYSIAQLKLMTLLIQYMRTFIAKYPTTTLIIKPVNETSYRLMEYLFTRIDVRGYECIANKF